MPDNPVAHQSATLIALICLFAVGLPSVVKADDFSTLFSTPQERRLIDSNRYRVVEQVEQVETIVEVENEEPEVQPTLMTEISSEYRISGITVSADGVHSVWVNGLVYESGDTLEDGSQVQVLTDQDIKARITTPDGGRHLALAGETIQVTYQVPVVKQ